MKEPEKEWARELREVAAELEAQARALDGAGPRERGAPPASRLEGVLKTAIHRLDRLERSLPRGEGPAFPILVVDDDQVSRDLLVDFLSRYGPTTGAASGAEALGLVTRGIRGGRPFRVICLDLMMPEMDGHEVLKRIRSLEEVYSVRVPSAVATTTAVGDRETVLRARAGGSEAYFVKPIDLKKLGQWVEALSPEADPLPQ